jgi:glycerophosphoryl diester phosphodiesterase
VDAPERARELEALGVSYLITNRPGALREALRRERGP